VHVVPLWTAGGFVYGRSFCPMDLAESQPGAQPLVQDPEGVTGVMLPPAVATGAIASGDGCATPPRPAATAVALTLSPKLSRLPSRALSSSPRLSSSHMLSPSPRQGRRPQSVPPQLDGGRGNAYGGRGGECTTPPYSSTALLLSPAATTHRLGLTPPRPGISVSPTKGQRQQSSPLLAEDLLTAVVGSVASPPQVWRSVTEDSGTGVASVRSPPQITPESQVPQHTPQLQTPPSIRCSLACPATFEQARLERRTPSRSQSPLSCEPLQSPSCAPGLMHASLSSVVRPPVPPNWYVALDRSCGATSSRNASSRSVTPCRRSSASGQSLDAAEDEVLRIMCTLRQELATMDLQDTVATSSTCHAAHPKAARLAPRPNVSQGVLRTEQRAILRVSSKAMINKGGNGPPLGALGGDESCTPDRSGYTTPLQTPPVPSMGSKGTIARPSPPVMGSGPGSGGGGSCSVGRRTAFPPARVGMRVAGRCSATELLRPEPIVTTTVSTADVPPPAPPPRSATSPVKRYRSGGSGIMRAVGTASAPRLHAAGRAERLAAHRGAAAWSPPKTNVWSATVVGPAKTLAWDPDADQHQQSRRLRSHAVWKGRAQRDSKIDRREVARASELFAPHLEKLQERRRRTNQRQRLVADKPPVRVDTACGDHDELPDVVVGDEDVGVDEVGAGTDAGWGTSAPEDSATDVPTTARSGDPLLEDSDAELGSPRGRAGSGACSGVITGSGSTGRTGRSQEAEIVGLEVDVHSANSGHLEDLWEFVVQGKLDHNEKPDCAHKGMTCFPSSAMERIQACGIACICERGHRLDASVPNQDDFLLAMRTPVQQGHVALYGVFDGHGPTGHQCAAFARTHIPECVFGDPEIFARPKAVLRRAFWGTQRALLQQPFDVRVSGTTATIALVIGAHRTPSALGARRDQVHRDDDAIFVAHIGDSRAVLASRMECEGNRGSAAASFMVSQLTRNHRPEDPAEEVRVRKEGGEIRNLNLTSGAARVFVPGTNHPALALTRSLGDTAATECGVVSEPEITSHRLRAGTDAVLVLGTDGLFEFFSNRDVMAHLLQRGISVQVLEGMAAESRQRWVRNSYNQTVDDTTAIAVSLETHFGRRSIGTA